MNYGSSFLTVVIPMYRQDHLADLLSDLKSQSDRNFNLVIASDGPIDEFDLHLKTLISELDAKVIENTHRIGKEDPSLSWQRAVSQAPSGWIWLLGDDDRVGIGCVEAFNKLRKCMPSGIRICRFPVSILTEVGTKAGGGNLVPGALEPKVFLKNRLLGRDLSFASEYVFQKESLDEIGGFVHFPFAWCSDDATWLQLSYPNGIFQLVGDFARVFWRDSSTNTSSKKVDSPALFALSERSFINWAITESFLAGGISSFKWKLMFGWWFALKATQKELGPRTYWVQLSGVADDLNLSKLVMGFMGALLTVKYVLIKRINTARDMIR